MASTDPRIHTTTVIFTPTSTVIDAHATVPCTPYLRVQISPTKNGRDIESIKVWYSNSTAVPSRLNEEITDENTFQALVFHVKGSGPTLLDKVTKYMRNLSPDEVSIVIKEYTKCITDGGVLDGFIAGIGAYMAFLLLNENGVFANQMPFQFSVIHTVRSGLSLTRNMFQYLGLVLISLSRAAQGILLQLITFIQSFINIWEPLFIDGPHIDSTHQARMAMEVISGFSQHVSTSLAETRELNAIMSKRLESVETRLQSYVDDALTKMRREVGNLVTEARGTIKELSTDLRSQLGFIDDTVKDALSARVETQLRERIRELIETELEASQEHIGNLVRCHAEDLTRKLPCTASHSGDDELRVSLAELEHRIKILSDKISVEGLERITDTESHDGKRRDEVPSTIYYPDIQWTASQLNTSPIESQPSVTSPDSSDYSLPKRKSRARSNSRGPTTREDIGRSSSRRVPAPTGTVQIKADPIWRERPKNVVPWSRARWANSGAASSNSVITTSI